MGRKVRLSLSLSADLVEILGLLLKEERERWAKEGCEGPLPTRSQLVERLLREALKGERVREG